MSDARHRFYFPDTDLRGEFLTLETALTPILAARSYPLEVQSLLGEAVVAVSLMAGTLKFAGRLSLQAQGKGEVSLLLTEATHDNTVRGLAKWHPSNPREQLPDIAELLGENAVMAITLHPDQGNDYQSLVPLKGSSLAACLALYFAQSEQLPTRLWLAFGNGKAAGLLLQRLPEQVADHTTNSERWDTLLALASTLTTEEMLHLDAVTLLHRLFHETPPTRVEPVAVRFACTCSRKKVEDMLMSLGIDTLQSLLDEEGKADIGCDFCQQHQYFDKVDLAALIHRLQR